MKINSITTPVPVETQSSISFASLHVNFSPTGCIFNRVLTQWVPPAEKIFVDRILIGFEFWTTVQGILEYSMYVCMWVQWEKNVELD